VGNWNSCPGVKQSGHEVNTHFHLVPMLGMSGTIPLLPLYAFLVLTGKTLPFSVVWSMMLYNTEDHNMNVHFYVGIVCSQGVKLVWQMMMET